ncbi:aminotransferase [Pedobacter antarcticus 4BY]|uniref:Aminotransferase n=2 Tax=Pedobacter antarcticus TaxID=34086 RepID=A0A081PI68_9SPHI|nr:methionine aminotransferase [Pedobacter antarcticus]KEQ30391.1 aminotransferase [Pedobacter antarcticus 4BY]SFF01993.1 2-keto-4-methylthiobutyrate aminotransferase apoenzyme [Pedobacter antarcticus]
MIATYSKLPGTSDSIFTVMSQLATEHQAINLSQGFPDYECDPKLINFVAQAMQNGHNQYAPMTGAPALREWVAEKVNTLYGSDYHADKEVTITAGGTEAIFSTLSACINAGDEVIIFEPAYDSYAPTVRMLGGLVKSYEMAPPEYDIDWEMVKKLFTASTKMIILNSPHNPTGKILTETDIQALIKLTKNTDVLILSDEVYEHLIYDGEQHRSLAIYPELRERAIIIASFGKLLHATGWKTGYCLAPEYLMKEFRKVHQFNVFSVNTPMQIGIANYLKNPETYLNLSSFFQQKRDLFRSLLAETKFKLLPCKGSYFQCVSYEHFSEEDDTVMAKRLITDFGVASIPVSAFYTRNTDHRVLRFCFAKKQDTLEKSVERLMKL